MNETTICAVGNVATQPVFRELASGPSARFRLAVTTRYLDREKNEWTDGHTNFFTVWANRHLALNVTASLNVGDPVIVQGRLKVRSETREGQSRTSADSTRCRSATTCRGGRRPSGELAGRRREWDGDDSHGTASSRAQLGDTARGLRGGTGPT